MKDTQRLKNRIEIKNSRTNIIKSVDISKFIFRVGTRTNHVISTFMVTNDHIDELGRFFSDNECDVHYQINNLSASDCLTKFIQRETSYRLLIEIYMSTRLLYNGEPQIKFQTRIGLPNRTDKNSHPNPDEFLFCKPLYADVTYLNNEGQSKIKSFSFINPYTGYMTKRLQ